MIKGIAQKQKKFYKGQTLLEYAFLAVVVMVALMAAQNYIQKGMQGKWMDSLDSLGKQYDPQANVLSNHYTESESRTITTVCAIGDVVRTYRTDVSNMNETLNETTIVTY